jgi:hypothetical protein
MSAIDPLGAPQTVAAATSAPPTAAAQASQALETVGGRILAAAVAISSGRTAEVGDPVRRDAYGLADLAHGLAGTFGGSPAEEGALLRVLEDFARGAAVQAFGLQGGGEARALDALQAAVAAAGAVPGDADPMTELVARIEAAARLLPDS